MTVEELDKTVVKLKEVEAELETTREQLNEIKDMVVENIEPKQIQGAKPFQNAENNVFWGNFIQKTVDHNTE